MRIVVLDDYQGVALTSADWTPLTGREGVVVDVVRDWLPGPDAVVERLAEADVVVVMRERTPFPAVVLERLPRLRLLVTTGRANASIDLAAAAAQGVTVAGTSLTPYAAAETAFGLLLALFRGIAADDAVMKAGGWQTGEGLGGIGRELAGARLGLLGLGRLGARMARYALAFEMDVVAWSPNLTAERCAEVGARLVGREELFAASDAVSVHLVLSPRSRGTVGAADLARLGPEGYLVNTSRGPLVDEPALVAALREGTIAGAGLDVFDVEPLPAGHPLRTSPRVVLTPHTGYVTRENYALAYGGAVEAVRAWSDGEPVRELGRR